MDLRAWLAERRLRHLDFAAQIGTTNRHLSYILCNGIMPKRRILRAIEEATNGEVTAADMARSHMETTRTQKRG